MAFLLHLYLWHIHLKFVFIIKIFTCSCCISFVLCLECRWEMSPKTSVFLQSTSVRSKECPCRRWWRWRHRTLSDSFLRSNLPSDPDSLKSLFHLSRIAWISWVIATVWSNLWYQCHNWLCQSARILKIKEDGMTISHKSCVFFMHVIHLKHQTFHKQHVYGAETTGDISV